MIEVIVKLAVGVACVALFGFGMRLIRKGLGK